MKSKLICLLNILILISFIMYPQVYKGKGKMRGTVLDEENNPVKGVKVKLYCLRAKAGFTVKTNKKGIWKAYFIRGGQWHIDFNKEGYFPKMITSGVVKEHSSKPLVHDVVLKKIKGETVSKDIIKDIEKSNTLYGEQKYDEALEILKKTVNKFPDIFILYKNIGNCYFQKQDYDNAIKNYLIVLENDMIEKIKNYLNELKNDKDNTDTIEKIKNYLIELKNDKDNTDMIEKIGNCYSNKGDTKKALEWYGKIDSSKIKDPVVLYNIGIFNYNANNSKNAVEFFKRAIAIDNKYPDAHYYLGLSYLGLGKIKESIEIFKKYLEIDKDSARSTEVRGLIKELGGSVK